jgi:tetratricopeptide (TPR) repeat protein
LVENRVQLLLRKGDLYVQMGETAKAVSVAEDILRGGINKAKGYLLMVSAYEKEEGKEQQVDLFYRRALKEDPTNEETLKKYASYLYNKDRNESALVIYRNLTGRFPLNQDYWGYLGNIYLALGFYDKALVCYEKAHTLSQGKESWIIANIGNLYKNKGLYTKSIEYLRQAIEVDESSEYAHNRLAGAIELKNEEAKKEKEIVEKKEKEMIAALGEEALP